MQGIAERIRRIGQQPLARELERLDLFERVYFPWHQVLKEHAGDLRWIQYGYLLEEYRLAIFAPAISVKGRVSENVWWLLLRHCQASKTRTEAVYTGGLSVAFF